MKKKEHIRDKKEEEEEVVAVESRRWEGSAGKDERQQKETSTTVWWVFVLESSLRHVLSPSIFLSFSRFHRSFSPFLFISPLKQRQ